MFPVAGKKVGRHLLSQARSYCLRNTVPPTTVAHARKCLRPGLFKFTIQFVTINMRYLTSKPITNDMKQQSNQHH